MSAEIFFPLFTEINYESPLVVFSRFSRENGAIFLDSAQVADARGRYSFIAVDPFLKITSKNQSDENPFDILENALKKFSLQNHADLPPFQGGAAGLFSYDLCHHLEKLPRNVDELKFPDMAVGFYDVVIAFDEMQKRAWIFSSGFPELDFVLREQRAHVRLNEWLLKIKNTADEMSVSSLPAMQGEIEANFTAKNYQLAVEKVKQYIRDGDIFEANISQRFSATLSSSVSAFELYRRLRAKNPAPFAAYFNWDEMVIASASPERFLKLTNGHVESRPIKGTRPRGKNSVEDKKFSDELLQSEKDHAENVMIVDLLRNDLSRVCENHSVVVPQLCGLESYAAVHHLVSVVHGKLRENFSAIDLLKAAFPGGSITGAPKIRAMEIITEIEPTMRGPYCGSFGYIGFNGDMDLSIVIRTFAIKKNRVTFQAGGAIVLDSDAAEEYEETLTKVAVLCEVLK